MEKNEQILKNAPYKKLVMNLCLPTIIIMLVMVVYNMADIYFIGKTGDPYKIAAISLCGPLFSMLSGMGTLLGSGGCTAISLALGEKEYKKIKSFTSLCFYGSIIIGVIFSAVVLFNLRRIGYAIGSDEATIEYTCSYLQIIAIGAPVILFTNVFTNLIRADGAAKESMIANGLGTIANIILDPILIMGCSMGVAGAAIATVIGNILSGIYLIYYVLKKQPAFSLYIQDLRLKREIVLPIVTLGLPLAFSTILMSCSTILSNKLMITYGAIAVAANGVAGKVGMLISMIAMGICMGMQPAISYNYGAGAYERMRTIIKKTGIATVVVGTILTLIGFLLKNQIITAFIDNAEVIELGKKMVYASLVIGPFYGLYQLCTTFLQSTGKAGYATFVALLDKGLFFIPMLFLLNHLAGLNGLIYAGAVTNVFSLLVGAVLCFSWNRKIENEKTSQEAVERWNQNNVNNVIET